MRAHLVLDGTGLEPIHAEAVTSGADVRVRVTVGPPAGGLVLDVDPDLAADLVDALVDVLSELAVAAGG